MQANAGKRTRAREHLANTSLRASSLLQLHLLPLEPLLFLPSMSFAIPADVVILASSGPTLSAVYFLLWNRNRAWVQSETGGNEVRALGAAVVLFISLFTVVFLLTLLLFSLGWGFIRPSLRSKEGWLVSRYRDWSAFVIVLALDVAALSPMLTLLLVFTRRSMLIHGALADILGCSRFVLHGEGLSMTAPPLSTRCVPRSNTVVLFCSGGT